MRQDQWDSETTRQIAVLMQQPDENAYIDTLSSYLGADPALLRCLVHTGRCELSGNTLADLRASDEALKLYEFEQRSAVQSQQTKTY